MNDFIAYLFFSFPLLSVIQIFGSLGLWSCQVTQKTPQGWSVIRWSWYVKSTGRHPPRCSGWRRRPAHWDRAREDRHASGLWRWEHISWQFFMLYSVCLNSVLITKKYLKMISPLWRPCRATRPRWTFCICPTSLWMMQESTSAWLRAPMQERQYRPCSRRGWRSCLVRHTYHHANIW